MVLEQLLVKKKFEIFWGVTPSAPLYVGHPEKMTPPWLPMTPIFYSKILLYYQNEVVYKKLDRKISNIGRMASIFVWSQIFKIIRKILKIFISAHMHARNGLKSCAHSYLCIKIIFYFHDNSQICIHLWLSGGGTSEAPPPPWDNENQICRGR